jgi:predicted transcriptional regulator
VAKTDRIYIRVSPDLKEKLEALAKADHRSVSAFVELILIKEIEKRKQGN